LLEHVGNDLALAQIADIVAFAAIGKAGLRQVLHVTITAAGGQEGRQRLAVALHAVDKVALPWLV